MGLGCLVSLAFWAALGLLFVPNIGPLLVILGLMLLVAQRRSDWPLY
jgi:hypothetical protein